MEATKSKNILTAINQQTTNNQLMKNFRIVLKREIIEFENKIRKDEPEFDVYEWLGELLGYYPTTIRKWFNDYDQTGTKMGLKDLQMICIYIRTVRPIEAFLNETTSIIEKTNGRKLTKEFIGDIKSTGLTAAGSIGQLCSNIRKALDEESPGIIEDHEYNYLINDIKLAEHQLTEVKTKLNELKK